MNTKTVLLASCFALVVASGCDPDKPHQTGSQTASPGSTTKETAHLPEEYYKVESDSDGPVLVYHNKEAKDDFRLTSSLLRTRIKAMYKENGELWFGIDYAIDGTNLVITTLTNKSGKAIPKISK